MGSNVHIFPSFVDDYDSTQHDPRPLPLSHIINKLMIPGICISIHHDDWKLILYLNSCMLFCSKNEDRCPN